MVKTIKISEDAWKKLMRWRVELNCKNLEELIDMILKITTKGELEHGKTNRTNTR